RVMVHAWLERRRGVVTVTARHLGERATHAEVVIRCGRLRRGVFAGLGRRRIVGGLAATAVVRNMPGRLCGVVPPVSYDGLTDRIRPMEWGCGAGVVLDPPRL